MRVSDWSADVCSSDLDGAHRLDHAKDGRDDAKGRQGVGQALKIMGWADCFVMVGLEAIVHDVLNRVRVECSCGNDHQAQRVADEVDQRLIIYQPGIRSEEQTSELKSLMRISYAVYCLRKKKTTKKKTKDREP